MAVVTANAGPDQTVQIGQVVTLDASGSSDTNAETLSYSWICISGSHQNETLSGVNPTYTASTLTDVWQLTASDTSGDSATDTVTITVLANIRYRWDGSEIVPMRFVVKKSDGTFS